MNWQALEAVGVWIGAIAAIAAFIAAWRSLSSAKDQARAASEQAAAASKQVESLSRPVVVVPCSSTMPTDTAKWLENEIPIEIAPDHPGLTNIGSGPALNLTWRYERHHGVIIGHGGPLRVRDVFKFAFPVEIGVGPKRIVCEYSSVNGVRYRSTITLEDRTVRGIETSKIG